MKKITKKVVKKAKTKAERRIIILKDVLKQLKSERFMAITGSYVNLSNSLMDKMSDIENEKGYKALKETGAKECLLNDKGICEVCAKGAIFLSLVRKENKVKLVELEEDEIREKRTNALFGEANMNLMEAVFEEYNYKIPKSNRYSGFYKDGREDIAEISYFYDKYPDERDRLEAIVKNAIKNNGIFKF